MTDNTVQDQPETTAQVPENLTIRDLMLIRDIISVVAQRGAFKAEEMETVGKTFNKLAAFVGAAAQSEPTSDEQGANDE